jgi:hypothetical protein
MAIKNFMSMTLTNGTIIYGHSVNGILVSFNEYFRDNECFKPLTISQINRIIFKKTSTFKHIIESITKIPMYEYFREQLVDFKMNDNSYTEQYNSKRYNGKLRELYAVKTAELRKDSNGSVIISPYS